VRYEASTWQTGTCLASFLHVLHILKAVHDGFVLHPKEKKELTEEEKEYKSKRREIQEKLIKFATRIPVTKDQYRLNSLTSLTP
jgi:hypothetical protein